MCTTIKTNATTPWYSGNPGRPIVLLDMDDVVTNCIKGVVKNLNTKLGTKFKVNDVTDWHFSKCLKVPENVVNEVFRTPGFFEKLKPMPGAIDAINQLIESAKYDVYIITATSDDDGLELVEKIKWFKKYIPNFNIKRIISCKDKYIIRGDVLVDDREYNLDTCAPYMQCILMDSPKNRNCTKYRRIKSLLELPDILEEMFFNNEGGIKYYEQINK